MNALVERALKAHHEAQNLTQEAIAALLNDQKIISDQLEALGHGGGRKASPKPLLTKPKTPCRVCNSPDHDARFHRGRCKEVRAAIAWNQSAGYRREVKVKSYRRTGKPVPRS